MADPTELDVHDQVRAARREAYRDAILVAARSLFEARGFRAITMADIAKAAGVAKGTLYNYFDDKEEVFAELADRGREELLAGLDAIISDQRGWDRVVAMVRFTLEFLVTNASMLAVYMEATGGTPDSAADPRGGVGQQAFTDRLVQCLERLAGEGKLRVDMPVSFLVTCLAGSIDANIRSFCGGGRSQRDLIDGAEYLVRLFREGAEP